MRIFATLTTRLSVGLIALMALAATPVHAQQQRVMEKKVLLCTRDSCVVDTARTTHLRVLYQQMDSLQRVFFDRRLPVQDQHVLKSEIAKVIARLTELQQQGEKLQIQIGREGMPMAPVAIARSNTAALTAQQMVNLERKMEAVMPRGWIGISPMGPGLRYIDSTGLRVRYLIYPTIESVDPESPAERAGVSRGDLLLAFNGEDVTATELEMTKLLQPDHRLTLRVRRGTTDRDFAMVVGVAPESFLRRQSDIMAAPATAGAMINTMRVMPRDTTPPVGVRPVTGPVAGAGRVQISASATESPARGDVAAAKTVIFGSFDLDLAPVAGARMTAVDEDLGRALGVPNGVLVLAPVPGSIAAQAGLKSGDVIVLAGGKAVESVRDLRRTMQVAGGERSLELQIIRDRKSRTVLLKW